MNRLEELFLRWQEQDLSPQELEELARLLESPEVRARLVDEFVTTNTIREALRSAEVPGQVKPKTRRSVPPRRTRPGLPWGKLGLAAAAALLVGIVFFVANWTSGPDVSTPPDRQARQAEQNRRRIEEDKIRAEAGRKLAEIEDRRKILEERKTPPGEETTPNEEKRKQDLARLAEDRRRIEEEMKAAIAQARETGPAKRPEEPKTPPPPQENATAQTQPSVGQIERLEGEAFVVGKAGRSPARVGQEMLPGEGLATVGDTSRLVLRFSDGTRVELGGGTDVREVTSAGGKRIFVSGGTVRAWIARQPEGQPMIFATAHGEATVVGTTLRIVVDPAEKGSSRLDVLEGSVKLKNLAGRTVDVAGGHFAVAAPGMELVARPGPLARGLVGLWAFDKGGASAASDASGQKHDGKLAKGATWVAEGRSGGAVQLDGATGFVRIPRTARMESPAVTLALWVKPAEVPQDTFVLVSKAWNNNAERTHVSWSLNLKAGGVLSFWTGYAGNVHMMDSSKDAIQMGEWVHIAATYDPSGPGPEKRLYVAGKLVTSAAVKVPIVYDPTPAGDLYIGQFGAHTWFTKGLIDDVRIYTRALPAVEIVELAQIFSR